ncbi:MAG TPA: NAD(P)/FAD-dependent oxidoreductase [Anaerolineae bacterium]|nr:NAD(P)/FAD-dependent oxidoreductase [Anaerolineae bacterium]HNT04573.1 NAD(P)/FAD-dependent oxidoreductase [Anaerolineae bacterium]
MAQVLVVGGGASGMMAAGRAAECGANVVLLEKTPRLANKLRLTGKGRCNVTNQSELNDFVAHFGDTGRFLYGAFSRFFVPDLLSFLNQRGVTTVVERGGRVFPASNDARQVGDALEGYLVSNKVRIQRNYAVDQILVESGRVKGLASRGHELAGAAVILATGGASYPKTGSTGDGFRLAAAAGHHLIPIRPALIPLVATENWVKDLQGLSLRSVEATLFCGEKAIARGLGEMLFTHFGVSGPIVLSLSKRAVDALHGGRVTLRLNLMPGSTEQELERDVRQQLEKQARRQVESVLCALVPARIAAVIVSQAHVAPGKPGHQVTAAEQRRLVGLMQDLRLTISGSRPIDEAIITAGGVDTREVNPRTMESTLVRGLYFCGEVLDIDADTGGYNLQAAFSTGYLAGESAALACRER